MPSGEENVKNLKELLNRPHHTNYKMQYAATNCVPVEGALEQRLREETDVNLKLIQQTQCCI